MKLKWLIPMLVGATAAIAQSGPRFEVATIKPAAPDARGVSVNSAPGGRVNISNMTLKDLITLAWRVQPYQVIGGPPWLSSAHFDVSAKAEQNPRPDDLALMLQALLRDRFQLDIKRETRDMPIYALVLARKDGKLGPQLKETTCTVYDPGHPTEPGKQYCGGMQLGAAQMKGAGVLLSDIAPMLARMLGRTVVDKTGLTGKYDLSATWTPDDAILTQVQSQLPAGVERPSFAEGGPSIYTAFQEQLGLKLESQKGPVDVLAISKAEKPSEN